jgi:hypothetical protein
LEERRAKIFQNEMDSFLSIEGMKANEKVLFCFVFLLAKSNLR